MRSSRRSLSGPTAGVLLLTALGGCSYGEPSSGAVAKPSNPWSTVRSASAPSSSTSNSNSPTPATESTSSTSSVSPTASTTTRSPAAATTTSAPTASPTSRPSASSSPTTSRSRTPTATRTTPTATTQRTDANGFVLGGPAYPAGPSNYDHPSPSDCARFNTQLHRWSTYQNAHRPASDNQLPSSGDRQYLGLYCNIDYDATP